jgi:hypothetical protein
VPFRTVDLPDGLAERPICPDCEGMMRLVWIAADKQLQNRHTFGCPMQMRSRNRASATQITSGNKSSVATLILSPVRKIGGGTSQVFY